uniref:SAM-dependent MTase RsmB/NOP-type domain-containing protein n=1 Tax=Odontella aurita TaxID=265563 RepID=A0A7S4JPW7_9STRA
MGKRKRKPRHDDGTGDNEGIFSPADLTPTAVGGVGGSNPLSDARKAAGGGGGSKDGNKSSKRQRSQASSSLTPAERKIRELWHRKSGAGYALFVSYYGNQPDGVVAERTKSGEDEDTGIAPDASREGRKPSQQRGAGQSRAARRRKKKKKGGGDGDGDGPGEDQSPGSTMSSPLKPPPSISTSEEDSPLLRALALQPRSSHLRSYLKALSRPLPLTFRLRRNSSANEGSGDDGQLSEAQSKLVKTLSGDSFVHLVRPVPWAKDDSRTIYQSPRSANLSKSNLSSLSPELKDLLVQHSQNGSLARQEIGSMLPVLALAGGGWMKAEGRVLDMCASPGSKTLQAVEVVTDGGGKKASAKAKGRVVANDVHEARLASLRDAVSRSGLPPSLTSRIAYTNFDASVFPTPKSGRLFDAVIVDVPCSGDGTVRKDRHVLPMWGPGTGNALHGLQVRILVRALELVRAGGVVCYSTCSLNPVEDEAVVAAALSRINEGNDGADGRAAVELVEWPDDLLPRLRRRPGVKKWRIADYDAGAHGSSGGSKNNDGVGNGTDEQDDDNDDFGKLTWYDTFEDATEAFMPHAETTLWAPSPEVADDLKLERCVRLWPEDQDTGGFFVALIRKPF